MATTETRTGTAGALIAATAELVEERGPSGVSLREVARRVGVSHGAPMRHFSGIADLLTAVAVDGFRALQADVAASMARSGTDAAARLAGAGRGYVQCATARPGTFALMFRPDLLVTTDPDFAIEGLAAFGQLVDAVRAAQAEGWKRPRAIARARGRAVGVGPRPRSAVVAGRDGRPHRELRSLPATRRAVPRVWTPN